MRSIKMRVAAMRQCLESIGTTAGHKLPRGELNEPNACAV